MATLSNRRFPRTRWEVVISGSATGDLEFYGSTHRSHLSPCSRYKPKPYPLQAQPVGIPPSRAGGRYQPRPPARPGRR